MENYGAMIKDMKVGEDILVHPVVAQVMAVIAKARGYTEVYHYEAGEGGIKVTRLS